MTDFPASWRLPDIESLIRFTQRCETDCRSATRNVVLVLPTITDLLSEFSTFTAETKVIPIEAGASLKPEVNLIRPASYRWSVGAAVAIGAEFTGVTLDVGPSSRR